LDPTVTETINGLIYRHLLFTGLTTFFNRIGCIEQEEYTGMKEQQRSWTVWYCSSIHLDRQQETRKTRVNLDTWSQCRDLHIAKRA